MRRLLWLFPLLWLCSLAAQAACTVTMGNAAFGTQTSFALNTTEQQVSANLTVTCSVLLGLLSDDTVSMTVSSAQVVGTRVAMKRTDDTTVTDAIPVRVCGTSTCNDGTETAVSKTYTWNSSTLLGLISSKSYVLPVTFRTVAGQVVSAGPYRVIVNLSVSYSVCTSIGIGSICTGTPQTGTSLVSAQLDMTVTNDCITISAPDVSFGSAPLAKNFPTVSQTISVTCTKGSLYTVGINNGTYPNSSGVRNMANGSNRLSYDIYKGSNTTTRWGSSGSDRWSSNVSTGVSSDGLMRTYNYTAQVLPGQATPPQGTYNDTLVVDLAF